MTLALREVLWMIDIWRIGEGEKSAVHQTAVKEERPTKIRPWKYWTYVVYSDEPAMLSDQIRALYTDKK